MWDVIVVGFGYAGGVAAVEAHDAGARVLLLEKSVHPGGISICSAGGVRIATDADKAFDYLVATNGDTSPHAVLRQLADGMAEAPDFLKHLASVNGAELSVRTANANYPFPGHQSFGFATVEDVPDFDPRLDYPYAKGSPAGARLFKVVADNVASRGIEVRLGSPVRRLIRATRGGVRGVDTGEPLDCGAVVLACGGFEGDPGMQRQFWQAKPVLNAAYAGNTGDGIRMAQELGCGLWHMWHYHGSYGFRHTDETYPYGIPDEATSRLATGRRPASRRRDAVDPARSCGTSVHERVRAISAGYRSAPPREVSAGDPIIRAATRVARRGRDGASDVSVRSSNIQ